MQETQNPNHVKVTVDSAGNPVCEPHDLQVIGSDVELKFSLHADGYVFPKDGAVVIGETSPQFPTPSRTLPPHDTKATLFDRNTGPGEFTYTVKVQKVSTGETRTVDPIINNGP